MADILRFPFEPFVWLWTALILGIIVALPDRWTKAVTSRDNLGPYLIVAGSLLALMLTGIVDFDAIRRSGPLVNVLKYIFHPLTLSWTLILIGIVIVLPDTLTDPILSRDKIGYFIVISVVLAMLFGIGLVHLDQYISFQFFLGIAAGIAGTIGIIYLARRRLATSEPVNATTGEETIPADTNRVIIRSTEVITDGNDGDNDDDVPSSLPDLPTV